MKIKVPALGKQVGVVALGVIVAGLVLYFLKQNDIELATMSSQGLTD